MLQITGLKEFQKKLDSLAKNAEKLDGQHQVPIADLLTPAFVSTYTQVNSADELFNKSGFKIESADDFKAIPDEKWDSYIRTISDFPDWTSMLSKATEEWVGKKLAV